MKLYDCLIAPNPRRVRIFLDEKGIEIEKVEIDILTGQNLKPEFLEINPRGIVPVLELDDGTRIDEAAAIWRYFEESQPEPSLMGRTPLEKAQIECWERRADQDGMLSARDFIRNQVPVFSGRGHPGRNIDAQIDARIRTVCINKDRRRVLPAMLAAGVAAGLFDGAAEHERCGRHRRSPTGR